MEDDQAIDRQLTALADPTRRAVYDLVRANPSTVTALAAELPVSQPAVSQHLKVLAEADLVSVTAAGTRRIYRADPAGVQALRTWVDGLWDDVLDSFVDAARDQVASESTSTRTQRQEEQS